MLNFGNSGQGGGQGGQQDELIFDVTDAEFMAKVVDASKDRPVIVDFWAPWCGPCKTLGPALEQAVRDAKGKVALAKVDIDKNPMVAGQLRVQSIPAVFAFLNGQPIDGFMGALPPGQIAQFVQQVAKAAGPSEEEADLESILEAAEAALGEGAIGEAAQAFAAVLQAEPTEIRAIAGLARCYAAGGDLDRARQTLEMAPADKREDPAMLAARSAIDLAEETAGAAAKLTDARAKLERDPADLAARYDLSLGLLATGDREGAVDELLEIFRRDRTWNEEAAKTQLMKLFEAFGPTDPLTLNGRRRLSSMIFA